MELNLDDVRDLSPDELYETDVEVLKENQDDLTEEEREKFSGVVDFEPVEKEEVEEEPEEEPIEEEPEEEKEEEPEEELEEEKPPIDEEKLTDDLRKIIREETKTEEEPEEEKTEEEKVIAKFFDEDYKPENWNDFVKDLIGNEKVVSAILEQSQKITGRRREQIQKEINKINEKYDQEIESLREAGEGIPEKGTEEFVEFDQRLSKIALDYGVDSMEKAYKIYQKVEAGEEETQEEPKEEAQEESEEKEKKGVKEEQKDLAKKIGKKSGESSPGKQKKYSSIAGKSPSDIVDKHYDELS